MIPVAAIWLVGSMLIGFLGRNYRFGFWGYFFASILFTPIIALLMLLAAVPRKPRVQTKVVKRA
jgi:hypothetical protein